MTQIRIDDVMKSSTGKSWRVKSGNQWYGADLDSGVELMKGHTISASVKTSKAGPWLTGIAPEAPSAPTQATGPISMPHVAIPNQTPTIAPYWLPMASNCVAHAISVGSIKGPDEIKAWVLAVKEAIEHVAKDDVNF